MRRFLLALLLPLAASSLAAATFTVTNTSDSGPGSLRQAILDANANPGADTIGFAISGAGCSGGVCTIKPQSALHWFTSPVTIDGYTQPGATPNTNASGAINAALKVVLSGVDDPDWDNDTALEFLAGSEGSTVKGLVVQNFSYGISIWVPNVGVQGCFLGTDASGMTAGVNLGAGVYAFGGTGASAITIGGPQPADRNLLPSVVLDVVAGATVEGNLIGTDATGAATLPAPDNYNRIWINSVGGTTFIRGNVVSGAGGGGGGVIIGDGSPSAFETILQGNFIGTDATGTVDLGNGFGIEVDTTDVTIGGTGPGEGNVIAFNGGGVWVGPNGKRCTIRGNSIHSNARQIPYAPGGILLFNPSPPLDYLSPLPNDPGDADTGANERQNFPVITSVVSSLADGGTTTITGLLNSTPNTLFELDFYSNPSCLHWPRSYVEGETYLGSDQVTTDGNGDAPINVILPVTLEPGARVAATATDPDGNTSEFSQRIVLHTDPGAGNPAGVAGAELYGFHFLPGATVTVGGLAAPSVVVNDYYKVTFTTPSLTPGTVNDIVLTNTDGTTGTLPSGWVADFPDVPDGTLFWSYVAVLVKNLVTAGVGGGLYGVDQPTKRQQMAVFLLKGKYGICYTPPPCTAPVFPDVPCTSGFAPWINELVAEGITAGCGGGLYCPANPVNRQQMAVFLLKALEGGAYAPPACTTATFTDVPCSSPFAPFIYELVRRGITAGCGNGTTYCPGNPTTRGQMAVFLGITFNLQH
jgi:hypothetical protein